MTELSDAALRHAGHGRPVLPCNPRTKAPMIATGFKAASTDPDLIRRWFENDRPPMIGMPTGIATKLVVLDSDGEIGTESLRALEREHEPLPRTASVVTPGGGQHFYLKHPGEQVRCSAGKLGPGLDVRGDGGFVIVPPSRAANGRRYEADEEAPAAQMPGWLLKLVRRHPIGNGHATPAGEWLRIVRDGLPEGERNDGLARLTGYLLRKFVDVDLTAELLYLVNGRCRPPLPAGELDRILESICARELRRRQGVQR